MMFFSPSAEGGGASNPLGEPLRIVNLKRALGIGDVLLQGFGVKPAAGVDITFSAFHADGSQPESSPGDFCCQVVTAAEGTEEFYTISAKTGEVVFGRLIEKGTVKGEIKRPTASEQLDAAGEYLDTLINETLKGIDWRPESN